MVCLIVAPIVHRTNYEVSYERWNLLECSRNCYVVVRHHECAILNGNNPIFMDTSYHNLTIQLIALSRSSGKCNSCTSLSLYRISENCTVFNLCNVYVVELWLNNQLILMIVLECEILCLGFAYFATLTITEDDRIRINSVLELQFVYRISFTVDFLKGVCKTHWSSCPWIKLLNLSIAFASPSVSEYFIPISTINELNSVVIQNDRLFLHCYVEVATVPAFDISCRIESNGVLTILCDFKVVICSIRIPSKALVAHHGLNLELITSLEFLGQLI